jgi:uncharacterized protein (UPF0333 family)
MIMSDKDIDQLFYAKLSGMEIEPSARVWENIVKETDGTKKQKSSLPFLQIAAGVILLMSFGFFLLKSPTRKIALHGKGNAEPTVNHSQLAPAARALNYTTNITTKTPGGVIAKIKFQRYKAVPMMLDKPKVNPTREVPVETDIANINTRHNEAEQAVVLTSTATAPNIENATHTENQVTLKATALAQNALVIKEPGKRKRIHTLGDLLNVVIAKVDKREDKLIQFTNSSDDDSFSITGVNLGIISTKKEKS